MNNLKTIKSIVSKLTREEERTLIKYLKYYSGIEVQELKSVQLFRLLRSNKEYSSSEIQKQLYNRFNYYAFNKLLNRLKLKIFEIVSFDSSLQSNSYSRRNLVLLELRKKLLQADILQLKGLRRELPPIYNQIIKRSIEFELYEIQSQALVSKQRLLSIDSKIKYFQKLNIEIEHAEECLLALKNSNNIYKEITNRINNSNSFSDYESELLESIEKLKLNYEISKSPTIGYFLFTLIAERYQNLSSFDQAQNSLERVKGILLENESAFTLNRYGMVLINLSNNYIFLREFDKAISMANESKKYFKSLPYTLRIVDEILFYALFYQSNISFCQKLLSTKDVISNELMEAKFKYFSACLSFVVGKFDDSIQTLLTCKDIEKDKEGWNINRRILLILNRIELQDFESVDLQVQNLEQFIKRISKSKSVRSRYSIILKILIKLVRENYDFEKVLRSREKYFDLLENESNQNYRWEIKSPELIIFNDWFKSKIRKSLINLSVKSITY